MVLKKARDRVMRHHGGKVTPPGAEYLKTDKELKEYRKKAFTKPEKQIDEYYEGFDNCVMAIGFGAKSFDLRTDGVTVLS